MTTRREEERRSGLLDDLIVNETLPQQVREVEQITRLNQAMNRSRQHRHQARP
jgi:hypothetical protein